MLLSSFARTALATTLAGTLMTVPQMAASAAGPVDDVRRVVVEPQQDRTRARSSTRAARTVRVGTFNITGSIHTRGGDRARTARTARQLERRRIDLMGLQEVQPDQLRVLRERMPRYRFAPGLVEEEQGFQLQVVWKRRDFDLLAQGYIRTPFNDNLRRTPWVRLRHEATGRTISVMDVHNPSKSQERNRDRATRQQVRLFRRLRDRGVVLLVGDMNEKREFFCKVTGRTDARASTGGSHGARGCRPPSRMSIDWLTGGGRFAWGRHRRDDVNTSDHAIHHAPLTLR